MSENTQFAVMTWNKDISKCPTEDPVLLMAQYEEHPFVGVRSAANPQWFAASINGEKVYTRDGDLGDGHSLHIDDIWGWMPLPEVE